MSSSSSDSSSNSGSGPSPSKPQLVPRADSRQARKAAARHTNTFDKLSLSEFLKESEKASGAGAATGKTTNKDGGGDKET